VAGSQLTRLWRRKSGLTHVPYALHTLQSVQSVGKVCKVPEMVGRPKVAAPGRQLWAAWFVMLRAERVEFSLSPR
jgi:hypothetical protein